MPKNYKNHGFADQIDEQPKQENTLEGWSDIILGSNHHIVNPVSPMTLDQAIDILTDLDTDNEDDMLILEVLNKSYDKYNANVEIVFRETITPAEIPDWMKALANSSGEKFGREIALKMFLAEKMSKRVSKNIAEKQEMDYYIIGDKMKNLFLRIDFNTEQYFMEHIDGADIYHSLETAKHNLNNASKSIAGLGVYKVAFVLDDEKKGG